MNNVPRVYGAITESNGVTTLLCVEDGVRTERVFSSQEEANRFARFCMKRLAEMEGGQA